MITYEMIPIGKKNAITREALMRISGFSDRKVRAEIRRLIDEGKVILSSSGNKGYYIPESYDELDHYIDENEKKARSLFKRLKSAKKMRKDMMQMTMEGCICQKAD